MTVVIVINSLNKSKSGSNNYYFFLKLSCEHNGNISNFPIVCLIFIVYIKLHAKSNLCVCINEKWVKTSTITATCPKLPMTYFFNITFLKFNLRSVESLGRRETYKLPVPVKNTTPLVDHGILFPITSKKDLSHLNKHVLHIL